MTKVTMEAIREAAEADLVAFIRLVAPHLVLGEEHIALLNWWQSSQRRENVLVLLPRAHLKSKLMAYKTLWELTRAPESTMLYVSATADLAEKQLHFIKNTMTSKTYMKYWPDMIHPDEGKRERWTTSEIIVDHPIRKAEGIRDPSIKAVGLTTNITGFHSSHIKLDDIVVPGNAYTEEGRQKVAALISQLASIKEPGATTDCAGTRYHPKDQYDLFLKQSYKLFDDNDEVCGEEWVWDSYIRQVETDGVFLWPKQRRPDGKMFGFDMNILSRIKAEYEDKTQFFAQYYNNPNDPEECRIRPDKFQYYDRSFLKNINDRWWINDRPLSVFAGIDFAFSTKRKADYTALAVVGIDPENNYYVLDIIRFKSDRIADYFDAIAQAYRKWGFRKIRCEVTVAQAVIVRDLKENYIKPQGLSLIVDEHRPTRHEGSKEERIASTLEPKYDNLQVWHYKGGNIQALEEELVLQKPPHDDCKDALTAAMDICVAPMRVKTTTPRSAGNVIYHNRFGGVRYA
jgi:phage terminase large subunit-like protein